MKSRNVMIGISAVTVLALTAIVGYVATIDSGFQSIKAEGYTVTLDSANTPAALSDSFNSTEVVATPSRYAEMGYLEAKTGSGHAILSKDGGTIRSITSIDVNITSFTANFTGGALTLYSGYADTSDWTIVLVSGTAVTFEGNYFKIVASGSEDVALASLSFNYTCSAIAAPSDAITNLTASLVSGDKDNVGSIKVEFDSVTGADRYVGKLYRGSTLLETKEIVSGDTFVATKQTEATEEAYSVKVSAYSTTSHKALTSSTTASGYIAYRNGYSDGSLTWDCYVTDAGPHGVSKALFNDSNCYYIGTYNSSWQYSGTGTFYWPAGDTLYSTQWTAGAPVYGKYAYANNMNYVGELNSAFQFNGNGIFSWSTTGAYSGGNAWEGHWTNGGWDLDVAGTFYYPQNWTKPYDGVLHYVDCKESGVGDPDLTTVTAGKYMWAADDSYIGAMNVSANNSWTRNGLGHQFNEALPLYTAGDWHTSDFGTHANLVAQLEILSETYGTLRCGGFYGTFISSTNWIEGNGCNVFYANDGTTPVAYITGTYSGGTTRTGAYSGTKVVMPGFESATDLTSYW